jgi:glycosyltransferase involved in cell wall biosynthesis
MRMDSSILVVSPEFGYGGIGGHTRRLVGFLIDEGFKVSVHTNAGNSSRSAFHPHLQINEIAQPIPGFTLFNPFFDILSSLQINNKQKPSLIIRPLPPFYPYIPKFSNTKIPELAISHVVFPAIGVLRAEGKMELKDKFLLSAVGKIVTESEKKMLQKAKRVIAVSEFTKRKMIECCGINEEKIEVVHNFVDTSVFVKKKSEEITSEIGRKIKNFKGNSLLAVFVAQLPASGAKNFELLFSTIAAASKIDLKFVIVGMGPDHPYAKSYVQRMGQDRILFLGYVNNVLLPDVYSQSDFLIIPSLYENLPTVLLEAMACGVIPVSTSVGGIPEVIDDHSNGFMLSPNKEEFIGVLKELCKSDRHTLDAISRRAEAKVAEKFDLKTVRKKYVDIVTEMVL